MAGEHVGDRLETPVGVGRKAGDVVPRVVGVELVEHQERIEARPGVLAEAAAQLDPGAVGGVPGADQLANGAGGHAVLSPAAVRRPVAGWWRGRPAGRRRPPRGPY